MKRHLSIAQVEPDTASNEVAFVGVHDDDVEGQAVEVQAEKGQGLAERVDGVKAHVRETSGCDQGREDVWAEGDADAEEEVGAGRLWRLVAGVASLG